jgi:hypothetical protein
MDEFGMDPDPPFMVFSRLTLKKLEDVSHNISMFRKSMDETNNFLFEFWDLLTKVVEEEIEVAKNPDKTERTKDKSVPIFSVNQEETSLSSLTDSIKVLLQGKSFSELEVLETEIKKNVENNLTLDPDYWDIVNKKLILEKAVSRLKEMHQLLYNRYLEKCSENQKISDETKAFTSKTDYADKIIENQKIENSLMNSGFFGITSNEKNNTTIKFSVSENENNSINNIGENDSSISPTLYPIHEFSLDEVMEPDQDVSQISFLRSLVAHQTTERSNNKFPKNHLINYPIKNCNLAKHSSKLNISCLNYENLERRLNKTKDKTKNLSFRSKINQNTKKFFSSLQMDNPTISHHHESCMITDFIQKDKENKHEITHNHKVYRWYEKFRPRKPKYFNRVHTGYEWNKYNQTHYDSENPPPKVVLGYKFNIFYPELIDKSNTPQYFVERDPNNFDGSTCIIRFHAGPPYEDIAFKILNKQWELMPKKGFRSVFERGVLHLYFNFVRLRYRR